MRIPGFNLLSPAVVIAMVAMPPVAVPQAIALPLRGEGEFALADQQYDFTSGSVLLQADSSVKIFFVDAGSLRTALVGQARRFDNRTIELAVRAVLGDRPARGSGRIRLRADGVVDALDVQGEADGRKFSARFETAVNTAALPIARHQETGTAPRTRLNADDWPWGGTWFVVDVTRRGEGLLHGSERGDYRFDRARLRLGNNDEFELMLGDAKYVVAGTWSGDLRFGPVPLELREAFGHSIHGMGRAWIRDRSWDRDFSLERVELDGWDGDNEFTVYFEAKSTPDDLGSQ
jgi:hypothetical protein